MTRVKNEALVEDDTVPAAVGYSERERGRERDREVQWTTESVSTDKALATAPRAVSGRERGSADGGRTEATSDDS